MSKEIVSQQDLIRMVTAEIGEIPQYKVSKVVRTYFNVVSGVVGSGKGFRVSGFGTFSVSSPKNPLILEPVFVSEGDVKVKFCPTPSLRKAVNS